MLISIKIMFLSCLVMALSAAFMKYSGEQNLHKLVKGKISTGDHIATGFFLLSLATLVVSGVWTIIIS